MKIDLDVERDEEQRVDVERQAEPAVGVAVRVDARSRTAGPCGRRRGCGARSSHAAPIVRNTNETPAKANPTMYQMPVNGSSLRRVRRAARSSSLGFGGRSSTRGPSRHSSKGGPAGVLGAGSRERRSVRPKPDIPAVTGVSLQRAHISLRPLDSGKTVECRRPVRVTSGMVWAAHGPARAYGDLPIARRIDHGAVCARRARHTVGERNADLHARSARSAPRVCPPGRRGSPPRGGSANASCGRPSPSGRPFLLSQPRTR